MIGTSLIASGRVPTTIGTTSLADPVVDASHVIGSCAALHGVARVRVQYGWRGGGWYGSEDLASVYRFRAARLESGAPEAVA
jgi:hypothetical protein